MGRHFRRPRDPLITEAVENVLDRGGNSLYNKAGVYFQQDRPRSHIHRFQDRWMKSEEDL